MVEEVGITLQEKKGGIVIRRVNTTKYIWKVGNCACVRRHEAKEEDEGHGDEANTREGKREV